MKLKHCTLITTLILSFSMSLSAQSVSEGTAVTTQRNQDAVATSGTNKKSLVRANPDLFRSENDTRWGVRTNFIADATAFVNLGLERSVGDHLAVTCDVFFPWWNKWDNSRTTQVLAGSIEGRYYWRPWTTGLRVLSGPFVGLHAAGGVYDIARQNKGSQGKYFAAGGAVLGYSAFLDKWWRLDLSFGVGYMTTKYDHYHVKNQKYLFHHYSGKYNYVGPTKAELSVVWLFSQCWQDKR